MCSKQPATVIWWLRKGLRLDDNPALLHAVGLAPAKLLPVFVLDPHFTASASVSANRWQFLLDCLSDLQVQLSEGHKSALYVVRGRPHEVLPELARSLGATAVVCEQDTEPWGLRRDTEVATLLRKAGSKLVGVAGHTLWDPWELLESLCKPDGAPPAWPSAPSRKPAQLPGTYASFTSRVADCRKVELPSAAPKSLPPPPDGLPDGLDVFHPTTEMTVKQLLVDEPPLPWWAPAGMSSTEVTTDIRGGERRGLGILEAWMADAERVANFSKPKTDPSDRDSTTLLSPFLKFGALGARRMWHSVEAASKGVRGATKPPVSLHGQLLWREFFYLHSLAVPHFDDPAANVMARDIPWTPADSADAEGAARLRAWAGGRTGLPWIDAIMTDLRQTGWIHHIARHCVACFLTRGDLWVHWRAGREVFEYYLLDADWALNTANWMWLSATCYFAQYHRVYSPLAFPKKYGSNARAYVRKHLPELEDVPDADLLGPREHAIVEHAAAVAENKERMRKAFAAAKRAREEQPCVKREVPSPDRKRRRRK